MLRLPTEKERQKQVLTSLYRLGHDVNFRIVMDWIQEEHDRLSRVNAHEKEDIVNHWRQGSIQFADFFISCFTSARSMVEKLSK